MLLSIRLPRQIWEATSGPAIQTANAESANLWHFACLKYTMLYSGRQVANWAQNGKNGPKKVTSMAILRPQKANRKWGGSGSASEALVECPQLDSAFALDSAERLWHDLPRRNPTLNRRRTP